MRSRLRISLSLSLMGIEIMEIFLLKHMGQLLIVLLYLLLLVLSLFCFLTKLKTVAFQKHF